MLPILIGISAVLGAIGAAEAVDGYDKLSEAEEIVERNKKLYEKEREEVEKVYNATLSVIKSTGKKKLELFELMKEVAAAVSRILNGRQVKLKEIPAEDISQLRIAFEEFECEISKFEKAVKSFIKGTAEYALTKVGLETVLGAVSAGALSSLLPGTVMEEFVVTAIGAEAAAGIGGAALTGGLALGPVLFFAGLNLSEKGEEALTKAVAFEEKVKAEIKKFEVYTLELKKSQKFIKELYTPALSSLTKACEKVLSIEKSRKTFNIREVKLIILILKKLNEFLNIRVFDSKLKLTKKTEEEVKNLKDSIDKLLGGEK